VPPPAEPTPEEVLKAARQEAEELLAAARREAEELRKAARSEGLAEGLAQGRALAEDAAGRWGALASELAALKPQLYDDARTRVVDLCLALLTIRVHPADLQGLLEAKPQLLATFDGVKKLTVVEDPSVGRGGCLVETPTAEIDARLDSQFRELARIVKKP
jgi:flagellar biosynthesis/type III secretory pathway protein FliH